MDGAAQKQETAVGNMWRLENKGGMGGYFFLFIYTQQAMMIRSRVGWMGTCSKQFDDQNKDNNQNNVEKKNSATRQILKD